MRKVVYSLLLALMATPVWAADLFYVGSYDYPEGSDRYYADLKNARRNGDIVMVRTIMVFGKPFMDGGAGPVTYNISVNAIDCKSQAREVLTVDEYNSNHQVVKHFGVPTDFPAEYRPLVDLDKVLARKACQ
jgi:hypothetical protein